VEIAEKISRSEIKGQGYGEIKYTFAAENTFRRLIFLTPNLRACWVSGPR